MFHRQSKFHSCVFVINKARLPNGQMLFRTPYLQQTECVILTMGCEKTTNDAIKYPYHFLLSDAQPDFSGTFHQDFSHIAQAR